MQSSPDGLPGQASLRLLTRMVRMDETWQPPASMRGAQIMVTGRNPVAEQLAGRLRELGADVRTSAVDGLAPGEVRGAEGLILLDGLAEAPASLLPTLLPLIRDSYAGEDVAATGLRWLLAAGYRANPAAGLAGLFRAIACEYPGRQARYVELDRVIPADSVTELLLAELAPESPRARRGPGALSPFLTKLVRPIRHRHRHRSRSSPPPA